MLLIKFLNNLFKKDGFLLEDANGKEHIIGKPASKNLIKMKMESKMILQIHDELLFEYPESEEQSLIFLVTTEMEKALPLSIPVVVEYGIGDNWYEAH